MGHSRPIELVLPTALFRFARKADGPATSGIAAASRSAIGPRLKLLSISAALRRANDGHKQKYGHVRFRSVLPPIAIEKADIRSAFYCRKHAHLRRQERHSPSN